MRKIISVLCGMALSVAFILPAAEALAANSAPTVDTVTPTSGKSDINQTVTFTTTASDADGWQDLQNLYFIVHATGNGAKACYVKYYRRDNKIYLRNDANSAWLGGYAPGSAKTIENSYAKVDCASTTVSGSGNTLTVTWSISFKSTYVGVKNTYLQATDMSNASSGWIQKGSWMIGDVNAAQFVSQSIPATLYYNQDFTATITMKNTGTTTWTKANSYKLGTQNPAGNKTWGLNRVELSEEDAIEPGQSKTFTFTAKAPATAGTYNLQFKMVRELVAWFGNLSTNVAIKVTKEPYAAQFISQSVPAAVNYGQDFTASITMKNVGTNTWTKAENYKLGTQNPAGNKTWGSNRVELSDGDSIAPGQSKTFTFNGKAPATMGTYNFQFKMVRELVKWFGEISTNVPIKIVDDSAVPTVGITSPENNEIVRDTVNIQADVTDIGSGVNKVEFYIDDVLASTDTEAPYVYSWDSSNVANGSHAIKVIGYDNLLYSNSSQITVTARNIYDLPLKVISGKDSSGKYVGSAFYKNGARFFAAQGYGDNRGINVAVLHPQTGEIEDVQNFDNWYNGYLACTKLNEFIDSIPNGHIIMAGIADHGSYVSEETRQKLESAIGSKYIREVIGWNGWSIISKKGSADNIMELRSDRDVGESGEIEVPVAIFTTSDFTSPAGSFLINNGDAITTSNVVSLDLLGISDSGSGMGSGARMSFSNDGTNWTNPEFFQSTKRWYINRNTAAVGASDTRIVYAKFSDADGNWSDVISSQIELNEVVRPQLLTAPGRSSNPKLARDDNNNVYAVWLERQYSGTAYNVIFTSSYDGGITWQAQPTVLAADASGQASASPSIACDNAGHVYVLYMSPDRRVFVNRSDDHGQTWLPSAINLSGDALPTNAYFYNLGIKSDNDGHVYAIWIYYDSGTYKYDLCFSYSSDFAVSWPIAPIKLNRDTNLYSNYDGNVNLECDGNGGVFALWVGSKPSENAKAYINYSYDYGVTWQDNEQIVGRQYPETYRAPKIGISNGNLFVSWIYSDNREVFFQRSSDRGQTWLANDVKVTDGRKSGRNGYRQISGYPLMESDDSGNIYIAWGELIPWHTYDEKTEIYFSSSRDLGSTWLANNVRIATGNPDLNDTSSPVLACDNAGGVYMGYIDFRDYNFDKPLLKRNLSLIYSTYLNYSKDYGVTWLTSDIRINRTFTPSTLGEAIPGLNIIAKPDGVINSVWADGYSYGSGVVNYERRNTNP